MSKKENYYLFNKIKSTFIIDIITEYAASNSHKFKLKLSFYSKYFQKKLGLDINEYKYNYYEFCLNPYLLIFDDLKEIKDFDKDLLYRKRIKKHNSYDLTVKEAVNIIEKHNKIMPININELINKKYLNRRYNYPKIIDIYSPFINFITSISDEYYINIPLKYIQDLDLINDYISFFEKNKKTKSICITINEKKQFEILKEIIKDFSIINKIYLEVQYYSKITFGCGFEYSTNHKKREKYISLKNLHSDSCLNAFFLLRNINKNIISLNLVGISGTIKQETFNPLNNFNSLKYLELNGVEFNPFFQIKIIGIEKLILKDIYNLDFDENTTKSIKYLDLDTTKIYIKTNLFKFPNLEEFKTYKSIINFDYSSLIKLKKLSFTDVTIPEPFIPYSPIEFINMNFETIYVSHNLKEEIKLFENILQFKTLKKININLHSITNDEILKITQINNTINDMDLFVSTDDFNFLNFFRIFPNVKNLNFDIINGDYYKEGNEKSLMIKNKDNIQIENIEIRGSTNIFFSFHKIKSIIIFYSQILDIHTFPLLDIKNKYIFESLKILEINCYSENTKLEIINNLKENIKNCKILEKLKLNIKILVIEQKQFLEFLDGILSSTIKDFYINIINTKELSYQLEYFSLLELKKIFKNKIYDNYSYKISKLIVNTNNPI